jgi:hypothetical protein
VRAGDENRVRVATRVSCCSVQGRTGAVIFVPTFPGSTRAAITAPIP